jgi:tricorn protease
MRRIRWFAVLLFLGMPAVTLAQIDARMLRYPDVSASQIAFVYAGDVWLVAKTGGVAERLSTPRGEEMFPRFSPDGSSLAYSADYDGNTEIYVVPAKGGLPTRVTHHPDADRMLNWYPDGSAILFASSRESGKDRFNQLYKVARTGGLPEKLPVPYGEFGAISPDGKTLAYMPATRDFRTWKRYRGGWAPDIWLFDLTTLSARNLTDNPANDAHPMFFGNTLYFLSDRDANERYNIWAIDLTSGATRQVTKFVDYDIHFPAIGPSDIVFENAGKLWLLELPGETLREVKVSVVTDRSTLKPRVENASKLIANPTLSPSGKRVIFQARGALEDFRVSWSPSGVTVPTFGIYSLDGEWIVEGHGVDPDIEVVDDPGAMDKGGDPQLERAIKEVMRALEANPPKRPAKPPYPKRSGR